MTMFRVVTINFALIMVQTTEIIALAYKHPGQSAGMPLMHEKKQQIPGAVQYKIKRYSRNLQVAVEDVGMVAYEYNAEKIRESYLQLKFCIAGNMYCEVENCNFCNAGNTKKCNDSEHSIDVISIKFSPAQLSQFIKSRPNQDMGDSLLKFKYKSSFKRTIPVCCKTKDIIQGLVNHKYSGSLENIYVNAQLHMLLLFSMDSISMENEMSMLECKFLTNDADQAKVAKARELLIQHIGEPITIKELSRKVAMNECYLKKGFKEMYGTTIFDFYQNQRMEHAKYLLYEKGLSVTDVSMMLGYSSISHFSTAFKKQTGLKPCELLFR